MSAVFERLMLEIYGHDIWQGIAPDTVDEQVQGWNGVHPSLSQLPTGFSEQIIIDIGVWKGQSTITLANNLRDNNIDGVVIAVDTFLGSPEHWDSTHGYFNRLNGMPDIYRTFLSNVAARGLTRFVIPMPQTSTTACAVLKAKNISPTLVHVDAAHDRTRRGEARSSARYLPPHRGRRAMV